MKFSINKNVFLKSLSKTQTIADKRMSMPILSNVLLETNGNSLIIKATNLEVGITLKCDIQTMEEGKIVLSSKSLFDIVKEMPDSIINFSINEELMAEISCGQAIFHISGIDYKEFPSIMSYEENEFSVIPIKILKEMIDKTLFSVSLDETRPFLNGAFFEYREKDDDNFLRIVTTDGRRLSLIDKSIKLPEKINISKGIIVPHKGLLEILKNFENETGTCEIAIIKNFLVLRENDTTLYMRLIDGTYPDYSRAIPADLPVKVFIDRSKLLSSLKRVSLVSDEKTRAIRLCISGNIMKIYTDTSSLGDAKEDINIECNVETEIDINFNSKLIIELMSVITEDKIIMELKDSNNAGIVKPVDNNDCLYVIMPLRT
jgi:DNA polymerase III subunit beta